MKLKFGCVVLLKRTPPPPPASSLSQVVKNLQVGEEATFTVVRDNQARDMKLTVGARGVPPEKVAELLEAARHVFLLM